MSADDIQLVPYDPRWPEIFRTEAGRIRELLGTAAVLRVEHMGSTAVPGLSAKPVIDMLIEIPSFELAQRTILPKLREEGWEYLWRGDRPPGHMMFIRRNAAGVRTHHVHMAPAGHPMWERLTFRDYLRTHPDEARQYEQLKSRLAAEHPGDREAYTDGNGEYVNRITAEALSSPAYADKMPSNRRRTETGMCFLNELAPITFARGFIEAPLSILTEVVIPWRQSLKHQVTTRPLSLPLRESLRELGQLSSYGGRELWMESHSKWLACFTNGLDGGYGPVSFLAQECKTRAVVVQCAPHTMPLRAMKDTKGIWGTTQFELYGPEQTDFLNYVGTVAAANDGGRWVFHARGEVQPFEQIERYDAPRVRDRFTPEMLESYCRALGIDVFNESFYKPSAVLMEDLPAYKNPPRLVSLAERRRELGLD